MSKKLNITGITNDLEGSAFFPGKKATQPSHTPQSPAELKQVEEPKPAVAITPTIETKPQAPERANAPTDQRPNGKRIITRN